LLLAALHGPTATPVWTAPAPDRDGTVSEVSLTVEAEPGTGGFAKSSDSDDDDPRGGHPIADAFPPNTEPTRRYALTSGTWRRDAVAAHAPRGPPAA
jgi:hypothetical protein